VGCKPPREDGLQELSFGGWITFEFAIFSWCDSLFKIEMSFNGLRLEYTIKGNTNYIAWKDRMEAVLEDNGLKDYIDKDVPKPDVTKTTNIDAWKKKVAKVRRILLEGV
jgi:hypothetical protein